VPIARLLAVAAVPAVRAKVFSLAPAVEQADRKVGLLAAAVQRVAADKPARTAVLKAAADRPVRVAAPMAVVVDKLAQTVPYKAVAEARLVLSVARKAAVQRVAVQPAAVAVQLVVVRTAAAQVDRAEPLVECLMPAALRVVEDPAAAAPAPAVRTAAVLLAAAE